MLITVHNLVVHCDHAALSARAHAIIWFVAVQFAPTNVVTPIEKSLSHRRTSVSLVVGKAEI
jgi:hypothetical protein